MIEFGICVIVREDLMHTDIFFFLAKLGKLLYE